jgi:hypothetical protein
MKTIAAIIGLCLVGCSTFQKPAPAFPHMRANQCVSVYNHLIDTHIQQALEQDYPLTGANPDEVINAKTNMMQEWHDKNLDKMFFDYCRDELRPEQASCMMRVNTIEQITLCAKDKP